MRIKFKHIAGSILVFILLIAGFVFSINQYVLSYGQKYFSTVQEIGPADAILVLGAKVYPNSTVSLMLNDRLLTGYELYLEGKAPKILVSGDHGTKGYDEVNTMKDFLKQQGVSAGDIFMDHAGFNTYDSMYRARDVFQVKRIIIVTQRFHLARALYIARELGLEAHGVAADKHVYHNFILRSEIREIAARNKDFFLIKVFKPLPRFLGEVIPISGDGNLTDDK